MSVKKIRVEVDEQEKGPSLSVVVKGLGRTLSKIFVPRNVSPKEISDHLRNEANSELDDASLSLRERREKYDVGMEASEHVPGLKR
ncbi:MAG TPA: hypothetical protein VL401_03015 [Alphaproteobacteria bacterium]|jgi:hypothetical protein|nr:hypothetical protein [Alphaproteobacteria bacterium]